MKKSLAVFGCFFVQSAFLLAVAQGTYRPPGETSAPLPVGEAQLPVDVSAQKRLAKDYLRKHMESEALPPTEAAYNQAPSDVEAARLYVTALARNGKYEDAAKVQLPVVRGRTESASLRMAESGRWAKQADDQLQTAHTRVDYETAAGLFERAVSLDGDNPAVRLTLGWVYLEKIHDPDEAYPHLYRAARFHPNDANARKLFGSACIQTGRLSSAEREFREASRLEPDDLWVQTSLAKVLARRGNFSEAESIYANVLRVDPPNVDARIGMAELGAWRGHTQRPLETLNGVISEHPTNVEALTLRGDVKRWDWQLDGAKKDYQQALTQSPDDYTATDGYNEARRMGATGFSVNGYDFEDDTDFRRQSLGVGVRLHVTDRAYLLAKGAGWRFTHPAFPHLDRVDAMGGLEYHWARWLETTIEGGMFDYDNHDTIYGGKFSAKISPTPRLDLYGIVAYNQPFVSSISTVNRALKEESVGTGVDWKILGPFSIQNSLQVARISDQNKWWEEKPQFSWNVFGIPRTYVRAEYDYLNYTDFRPDYWTPSHRQMLGPVVDTAIPIGKAFRIDLEAKGPYVFQESKWGFQAQAGPTLEILHVQFNGSYIYSSIPGDQGAWSGHGWEATLRVWF